MNYYKILNKNEKHYDMQYKTGLNTNIEPFNPFGDCKEGGIYFADKDILAFLWKGPWLRKVTIPEGEEIYESPGYPRINISNGQCLCADLLGDERFKFPLLNLLSGDVYVNSELKIRFQKTPQSQHFLTCLSFLSGLNEFHE